RARSFAHRLGKQHVDVSVGADDEIIDAIAVDVAGCDLLPTGNAGKERRRGHLATLELGPIHTGARPHQELARSVGPTRVRTPVVRWAPSIDAIVRFRPPRASFFGAHMSEQQEKKNRGLDQYGILYLSGEIDASKSEAVCTKIIEMNLRPL